MIKNLIFDLDGTLINDYKAMLSVFSGIVHKYSSIENPENYIRHYKNKGTRWLLKKLHIEEGSQIIMVRELLDGLNEKILQTNLHKEIGKVLKLLKNNGINLGLLTSNNQKNISEFLQIHKLNLFNFVYPDAGLFSKSEELLKILEKEGLKESETAYAGDEDRDVEAAKKAKIKAIAVSWGFNSKYLLMLSEPDYLIKKPSELLRIVSSN